MALILNIEFDKAGFLPKNNTGINLENLKYSNPNDEADPLNNLTVGQIRDLANTAISGQPSSFTPSQLNTAITNINENFDNGNVNNGFLVLP